ncbi:hypothetical protein DR871_013815 [Flavobacterium petrolei]|uniref:RHS repeat protein n=1 Tax=Flavobacterium petrolei TaxID=2259594 RepID=A0A482THR3_9FLAO|nr:hypothetical protein [Flavobacterium petrolei]RYJ50998.1 hypothetical protein DR871_013815 [Flavobacterium petrolei]
MEILEFIGLKQNVKSVKGFMYLPIEKFGEVENGKLIYNCYKKFNTKEQILEYKTYTYNNLSNGKIHETYLYNEIGNKIEKNNYYTNLESQGELLSRERYKYDESNNLNDDSHYNSDGSLSSKTTYTYNENQKEIEKKIISNWSNKQEFNIITKKYDINNNIVEINSDSPYYYGKTKEIFTLDERNNILIEKCLSSTDGNLLYYKTYKYDIQNNKIEYNSFNEKGLFNYKITYKYDERNNVTEENKYKTDGILLNTETCIYDENNKKIEESINGKRATYVYDTTGILIESNYYTSAGNLKSRNFSKFEYDIKGNWIKRIDFKDEKAIMKYERVIEYF